MARTGTTIRQSVPRPSAMIASAAALRTDTDFTNARRNNAWQKLAWDYYDTIGEFRYTVDWLGAMVGKTRLFAGEIVDGEVHEILEPNTPAQELAFDYVDSLFGGPGAKAEVMRQSGIHFTVAGEEMVLGTSRYDASIKDYVDTGWWVVASSELTKDPGTGKMRVNGIEIPGDHTFATRVWRPHPVRFGESNSASRAVLGILEELRTLSAHTMAQLTSRLAGAGILLLSDQLTLPTREVAEGAEVISASTPDEIIAILTEAASIALRDPGSAASLIPIIVTAPAEAIEATKHLTFWTPLDEHSKDLRDEALRRLALGMDVPPEVLTGVAETNHWAAWASDESGIKAHGEPLAASITQAFTAGLMWPTLAEEGVEQHQNFVIGGDTSAMRLRPNRAKEALELWDRGVLSDAALIRETGFDSTDMPTVEQYRDWVVKRIAAGSATPEQVAAAAGLLGISLPGNEPIEIETRESRPSPSLREHPEQGPPDREVSQRRKERRDEALVAACEVAMHRVMERAGNKLRNKVGRVAGVRAVDMYRLHGAGGLSSEVLLDDAWGHLEGMSRRLGVNSASLQSHLTAYAEELFASRAEMSLDALVRHLDQVERV